MFFYEIRVARKGKAPKTTYMEALKPAYVGEKLATILGTRPGRVTIDPISQATYIRKTRSD